MELQGCLLESSASGLREKDEDEDEAEEADAPVHEERGCEAKTGLDVPEGLSDNKPAEVGGHVGDGVSVASRPDG